MNDRQKVASEKIRLNVRNWGAPCKGGVF